MAGAAQDQFAGVIGTEARDYAIEIEGEFGFREQEFKLGERRGCGCDFQGVFAQTGGEFAQEAMNFAELIISQTNQFVVEVDGFHRLDEKGVAGTAGSVNDAVDATLAAGDDRHHKTVVADGDEVFLQILVMGAKETFEGFLNEMALLLAFAAEAAQGYAGVIGQGSIGEKFTAEFLYQLTKIGDFGGVGGEAGEFFRGGEEHAAGFGGQVEQARELVDFGGVEGRAFNTEV